MWLLFSAYFLLFLVDKIPEKKPDAPIKRKIKRKAPPSRVVDKKLGVKDGKRKKRVAGGRGKAGAEEDDSSSDEEVVAVREKPGIKHARRRLMKSDSGRPSIDTI